MKVSCICGASIKARWGLVTDHLHATNKAVRETARAVAVLRGSSSRVPRWPRRRLASARNAPSRRGPPPGACGRSCGVPSSRSAQGGAAAVTPSRCVCVGSIAGKVAACCSLASALPASQRSESVCVMLEPERRAGAGCTAGTALPADDDARSACHTRRARTHLAADAAPRSRTRDALELDPSMSLDLACCNCALRRKASPLAAQQLVDCGCALILHAEARLCWRCWPCLKASGEAARHDSGFCCGPAA